MGISVMKVLVLTYDGANTDGIKNETLASWIREEWDNWQPVESDLIELLGATYMVKSRSFNYSTMTVEYELDVVTKEE